MYGYWTAGISLYNLSQRQPHQWNPFPGVFKPLKPTTPWNTGEPNALSDGQEYGIIMLNDFGLDDYLSSFKTCVLCEIDMN